MQLIACGKARTQTWSSTYKIIMVMKLFSLFIIITCTSVSAATYAQRVTLSEKNAPLLEVVNNIQRQSGYQFFYKGDLLQNTKVSIEVKDATVQQAMDAALKDLPLAYSITNNIIVIKAKDVVQDKHVAPVPPKDVTGQVLDEKGIPLVGASVFIKRTQTGTLTDVKGNFTLRDILPTDVIRVTFIGFESLEVTIGDKTVFNLVMKETSNKLDQVVVQAYGQTSQRLATGDIGTVTAAEIERQPVVNPLAAIIGKIPGVVVTETNGYASAPFKVEIRGRSQLDPSRPSEPLYIIDDVPLTVLETGKGGNYATGSTGINQNGVSGPAGGQSPLFSINPNDIESITVLKDADATAIYGSRGANGVIIIKTKTGQSGKTKLDANFSYGVAKVAEHYELLNTQQYLSLRKEAFRNDGATPTIFNAYDLLSWDPNRYTDWQKVLWGGVGNMTNAQMALSGGDKQTTFRVAGSFLRQTTPLTISGADQRSSVQFNLTHRSLDQRLSLSLTSAYSYAGSNLTSLPGKILLAPNAPSIFAANGQLNWAGWESAGGNPFGAILQPYTANTGLLNTHLGINYELVKGLTASANFGYSTINQYQQFLTPISSQNPDFSPTGSAIFGNNNNNNAIIEPQVEYKKTMLKGIVDVLLGGSYQSVSQKGNDIQGNGYTNDNLLKSVSNAPTKTATDVFDQYKYSALFARVNYNLEDKYIINISARRDGSSRFGPGKQFGNFGAVGAAWIFSDENWVKQNLSFLSFGKIRGSYGTTGSDAIGDYRFLTSWSSGNQNYINGLPAYLANGLANTDLQWQVNKKLEGALDVGFFKDRLTLDLSWYRNIVSNELISMPLPTQTGFSSVTANLNATIQNTGLESTIDAKLIDKKDLGWSINFDIGLNRNKLLSFPNLAQSSFASTFVIGQSLNIVKILHYTGIDPQTGQYTFQDKNHDGVIDGTPSDLNNDLYNYDTSVKADGGFGTDLRYKGWQLNLFFHFRILSARNLSTFQSIGSLNTNYPVDVLNRWQKPGDVALFNAATTGASISGFYYTISDASYSNASYIRLSNASLSYNVPASWLKGFGIRALRIFAEGENLLLFSKYYGIDPDTPGFGGLPPLRTIVGGLQFSL